MKITDWAVVFVLVAGVLFWTAWLHSDQQMATVLLEQRYNMALRTASQDGASMLNQNELPQYEAGYVSNKFFRVDKEAGLNTLLHTLFVNFQVENDPVGQQALLNYIPAIAVIDDDGYSIYGVHNYKSADGEDRSSFAWFPKKPFSYTDASGNEVSFQMDNSLSVLDRGQAAFLKGRIEDITSSTADPLFKDAAKLEAVRRTTIVHSLETDLQAVIADHNRYARRIGISYTFTLPVISDEQWNNTIDDAGMVVFLQGIPLGDQYYNNFAFGGARLLKRAAVLGGVNLRTGIKYYYPESCQGQFRTDETFASERDAAAKGYFEAKCTRGD